MEDQDFFKVCGSILAILICLGLIGNVISLITWRVGRRCRNLPGATFFTALSFSGGATHDQSCHGWTKLRYPTTVRIKFMGFKYCDMCIAPYDMAFVLSVSTWIIVFLSIQRAIAVTQSLKSTRRTRRKKELLAVSILFAVSLVINLPFAFGAAMVPENENDVANSNGNASVNFVQNYVMSDLNETGGTLNASFGIKGYGQSNNYEIYVNYNASRVHDTRNMICGADSKSFYFKYEKEFHNWFMDFGLLFSAPVCILTVCNIIILVTVCRHKRNPALRNSTRFNGRGSSALTARVVMLSVVQCISVGPFSIASLIPGALPDNKAVDMVFYDRLFTITVMIWYLNNCVNFILYNVFGQAFRRDCMGLFRRIFRCNQRKQPIVISRQSKDATRTFSL